MAFFWRTKWIWLSAALTIVFGAGVVAGELLEQYDARVGFENEAGLIANALGVSPGMIVGDLRAGNGQWAVYMAQHVGSGGQVLATTGPNPTHELLKTVAAAGVDNVSVIASTPKPTESLLPSECCDAVLVRAVFHHLVQDRQSIGRELFQSVRAGGRLAVIEYDDGTREFRAGHGIRRDVVIDSLAAAGFELVSHNDAWPGHAYCLIFRRPSSSPRSTAN